MSQLGRSLAMAIVTIVASLAAHAADAVQLRPLASPIYVGAEGDELRAPEGVGCARSTIAVADSGNGRILLFEMGPEQITPGATIAIPQLPYPIRVVIDSKGSVLALDGKLRKIARLSPGGDFVSHVDLDDAIPRSLALGADDLLYVLDVRRARVLVLDADDDVQRTIRLPDEPGSASDLAVDEAGRVFVVDSVGRRVLAAGAADDVFSVLTDDLEDDLDFPVGIAVDGTGQLFVADSHGGGIVILGRDGSFRGRQSNMGWNPGLLRYPSGLCTLEDGHLIVADRGNNRVQLFKIAR